MSSKDREIVPNITTTTTSINLSRQQSTSTVIESTIHNYHHHHHQQQQQQQHLDKERILVKKDDVRRQSYPITRRSERYALKKVSEVILTRISSSSTSLSTSSPSSS